MQNLIGKTLNKRYRVEEFLGRGGMADVYKVWDSRRASHLAMKVLQADLAYDRLFIRRFEREAKRLAGLQHPNIVRFYGFEEEDMLVYFLMEYVEGSSLKAEIFRQKGHPMSAAQIRKVLRPVCSALYYAHQNDLVHCDIKPANIMLNKQGQVFLADFGIARTSEAATTATLVGMGTPAYMAPEQVKGLDPTPQTDIYALGIVLYEMLTGGERPFTGERAGVTGSLSEKVRWEQLNLEPIPITRFNPRLNSGILVVLEKCLAKDPQKRFATPFDFLNALEMALGNPEKEQLAAEPLWVEHKNVETSSPQKTSSTKVPLKEEPGSELNQTGKLKPIFLIGFIFAIILCFGVIFLNALPEILDNFSEEPAVVQTEPPEEVADAHSVAENTPTLEHTQPPTIEPTIEIQECPGQGDRFDLNGDGIRELFQFSNQQTGLKVNDELFNFQLEGELQILAVDQTGQCKVIYETGPDPDGWPVYLSLQDVTGDGYPELIRNVSIGSRGDSCEFVIYYYDDKSINEVFNEGICVPGLEPGQIQTGYFAGTSGDCTIINTQYYQWNGKVFEFTHSENIERCPKTN